MPALPPGTFALHPYAEPPLAAGTHIVGGDFTGLPGPVEPMSARVDVVAPRFTLPPDQILGTFPPAGAQGAFGSRLPQVVLRRRTLPWERSTDLAAATAPTPWLALVVIAEGEGRLLTNVPVADCVTAGTALPGMPGDADVPVSACLEVPAEVVAKVFPAQEDLALLAHVRAVDLADTELAMGDDDGWLAVVLASRLPQPPSPDGAPIRYLACLVSVEGQVPKLPARPAEEHTYVRGGAVLDLRAEAAVKYGARTDLDTAVMSLPGAAGPASASAASAGPVRAAAAEAAGPGRIFVVSASGTAAVTGAAWASGPQAAVSATAASFTAADLGTKAKAALADGFAIDLNVEVRQKLRFPALAYWSFTVTAAGDFQYLAEHVNVRLLGHVPAGQETPDGDPAGPGAPPDPGQPAEPGVTHPLPLVAETGHVALDHLSRAGEASVAWYRGPLTPDPVPRAQPRPDGRPPLAHHADQLRRTLPDGTEDLGYASAFEIGRLLALAQPGVVDALARWRQDGYAAARTAAVVTDAVAPAPAPVRDLASRPDVLGRLDDGTRAGSLGVRLARAVAETVGNADVAPLPPVRPIAGPSGVAAVLQEAVPDRGSGFLRALGLSDVDRTDDPDGLLAATAGRPVATGRADPARLTASLRDVLETEAMRTATAARVPPGGARPGAAATPSPEDPSPEALPPEGNPS
jgi:hypothetical protein